MAVSVSTRNGRAALTAATSNRSAAELDWAAASVVHSARATSAMNTTMPSRQIICIIGVAPIAGTSLQQVNRDAIDHNLRLSVDVVALVGPIVVIRKTFLLGDTATADDARLQVGDHGLDLRRSQRHSGRIQIIWRSAQWPSIASADLVGPFIERWHSSAAWLATTDHHLELRRIKSGGSQIGPGGCFIALLLAIREGAMAIRTARVLPDLQPGFHLVVILRDSAGREHADGGS